LLLYSKLYSNVVLSQSLAHEIIQYVDDLYKLTVEIIKHQYKCQENKRNVPSNVKDMCIILQNAFVEIKTEHKTLQYFIRHGYLIMPQTFDIAIILHPKRIQMHRSIGLVNRVLQLFLLKSLLIKFLQLPNVVISTLTDTLKKRENLLIIRSNENRMMR